MGRLAELFEKKAAGSMTEAEQKEYDQLMAEAKIAKDADGGSDAPAAPGTDAPDDVDDAEVDKAAQKLADALQTKMDESQAKNEKAMKDLAAELRGSPVVTSVDSPSFVVDKDLGKKSVKELGDMKIKLLDRVQAGKKITEISQRTTLFLKAFFAGDIQKLQILSEGTAADGGYLVPEEFANMIIEDRRDANIMREIAAPAINITTDTFHLPNLASRPKAAWRGEKAAKNTSTAQFGENVLTPYSLASIVPMTNEFVMDASLGVGGSVVSYISRLLGVSLQEEEEKAFWVGNGTGKPSGVDGGVYTLRTFAAGAGASDAQRADKLIEMFRNTPQGYRTRGVWVANMGTLGEIDRLKDSQGRYLLTDLANAPTQTIKGRPVYESNYLAGGTILFGDFEYYQIVDRQGISIKVSDEATVAGVSGFEKNVTFVRAEERVDAELTLPAAISKGTGFGTP